jgi:drug/metabolite transporter (DMT)-like permease
MNHDLYIAIITGLCGMFGWGLADLFAKKTIDEIGDIVTLVIAHIFGTASLVLVCAYIFISGGTLSIPHDAGTWLGLIFFGALQAAVYLLVYTGFGKGQVAVLNPVFASYSGLTAIISVLFLGEIVSGSLLIGLAILFIGILLLTIDPAALREKKLAFSNVPGFKEIAFGTILATAWTLLWFLFIHGHDWLVYAMLMYIFMTITLLLYARVRKIRLVVPKAQSGAWKYLVLIGVFETGAYLAISGGYGLTTHTSVVALLSGAFSLPTIILARVFLKERTTTLQAFASIVIIIGIMVLSVI